MIIRIYRIENIYREEVPPIGASVAGLLKLLEFRMVEHIFTGRCRIIWNCVIVVFIEL